MSAGEPTPSTKWTRAFRSRSFREIWTVSASFQFSYWFFIIAVQWLIAEETNNDPTILGIVYFAALSPMLMFSLHAGALLDRFDMRRTMAGAQFLSASISAVTIVLVLLDLTQIWILVICAFGVGVNVAIGNPASTSLTALTVPPEDLPSAIPLQTIAMNIARTGGPACAGLLLIRFGPVGSLAVSGAMSAVALVILLRMKPLTAKHSLQSGAAEGADASIAAGIRHARSRPPSGLAIMLVGATMVFGASYLAQLPAIAAEVSASSEAFIALTTAGGVGSLIGVLWVAVRRGRMPGIRVAILATLGLGLAIVAMALSPNLALSIIIVGLAGGTQFIAVTVSQYVVQSAVDNEFRGRVMSAFALAWGGMMPVGGLLLGIAMFALGVNAGLLLTGVATMAAAGLAWRRAPRS